MNQNQKSPFKFSIRELIDRAGGVEKVAGKLDHSTHTVRSWYVGRRRPQKGPLRMALCRMARIKVDDVRWEVPV